jgi:hypothetical protein
MPPKKCGGLSWTDNGETTDSGRQGAFKTGSNRGVASHHHSGKESDAELTRLIRRLYETLAEKLTWWNLGYRLGSLFKKKRQKGSRRNVPMASKQYSERKPKRQG